MAWAHRGFDRPPGGALAAPRLVHPGSGGRRAVIARQGTVGVSKLVVGTAVGPCADPVGSANGEVAVRHPSPFVPLDFVSRWWGLMSCASLANIAARCEVCSRGADGGSRRPPGRPAPPPPEATAGIPSPG